MNLRSWFESGPLQCVSQEEAAKWFSKEVELVMSVNGVARDRAEEAIRQHLGYASGYYAIDVAKKVYDFWGAEHPFFGTPEQRVKYTPEELDAIGQSMALIARGKIKAQS